MLLKVTEVILSLFHAVISPAYRRKDSRDRGISNRCDDDGPYSLSYPSNCLVYQTLLSALPNLSNLSALSVLSQEGRTEGPLI